MMFPGYELGETTQRIAKKVFDAISGYDYGIILERRPECSGSDKRCRVSHYCSKKRIILTAERI